MSPFEPDRSLNVRIVVDAEATEALVMVSLEGPLDVSTAETLEHSLRRAESVHPDVLVFDLRRLVDLDSVGLLTLLGGHGRLRRLGSRVILIPGSAHVQRLFRRTGLEDLLEFRRAEDLVGSRSADDQIDRVLRRLGAP